MRKISILSDHVANQIAAGEVIERPVAVIKELLENSLDAGATRIEIEFHNGGKSYMSIEDNGCGMSPDDALLCLERHATSKITEASDLIKVRSFGFRGEAIPSIASVSRFTLRTRSKDGLCGCEIFVNGGKLIHRKEYGMAIGTQIEVANLFNSVPVRRKFLKTDNTEAAHIIFLVRLYAVGHPNVSFTLIEDGREVFKSLASSNLVDRISSVWNQKLSDELIDIDTTEGEMRLSGLISKPGIGRSTRQEMITFINNRPVDSKTLDYALIESYHTYIPKGRYPIVFLFLEIDPELVDVNVHPAKREVRFRNEGLIRQFVISSILGRLRAFNLEFPYSNASSESLEETSVVAVPAPQVIPASAVPQPIRKEFVSNCTPEVNAINRSVSITAIEKEETEEILPQTGALAAEYSHIAHSEKIEESTKKTPLLLSSWKFIGPLSVIYGLFETSNGLIVMNFKRARQRVLYERIQKSFKEETGEFYQPLLFPIPFNLDALTASAFDAHLDTLNRAGLKIELFGRNFYRIEAVPFWLEPGLAEKFVRDTAGLIREQG
ncbi:MAG: DNA mismatch repair protein MutL, partial [Verrucomicrobia bacterium]